MTDTIGTWRILGKELNLFRVILLFLSLTGVYGCPSAVPSSAAGPARENKN
jgi:hypothetical protein